MRIRCFTVSTIHKYSIHCVLFFYWIHYVVVYIFGKFWCLIKKYVICMISFSRFSDVLTAFTYARTIGNLWNICYAANILSCVWSKTLLSQNLATRTKSNGSPLPLSCLLKSRLFLTVLIILSWFLFSGISFLIISFLKLISSPVTILTNCSF